MGDAGIMGYSSKYPVINLDGLINNWEYQNYLSENKFRQYLYDKDIGYIAKWGRGEAPVTYAGGDFQYSAYSRTQNATVRLRSEDRIYFEKMEGDWWVTIWKVPR